MTLLRLPRRLRAATSASVHPFTALIRHDIARRRALSDADLLALVRRAGMTYARRPPKVTRSQQLFRRLENTESRMQNCRREDGSYETTDNQRPETRDERPEQIDQRSHARAPQFAGQRLRS